MKSYHFKTVTDNDYKSWLGDDKINSLVPYNQTKLPKENIVSRYFDCHDMLINECYHKLYEFIDTHYYNGTKKITVVTGKSGNIRREFSEWMRNHKFVRYFKIKQNKGSWDVFLRY